MLRVEHIKVSYDEVPALHEVSFKVEAGQIVSIVGANGAGKSTILKALSSVLCALCGEKLKNSFLNKNKPKFFKAVWKGKRNEKGTFERTSPSRDP